MFTIPARLLRIGTIVLACTMLPTGAFCANDPGKWYVTFYEHSDRKGKTVSMISKTGYSVTPINEFEQFHLQDKISYIEYRLPKGAKLICYSGRFWGRNKWFEMLRQADGVMVGVSYGPSSKGSMQGRVRPSASRKGARAPSQLEFDGTGRVERIEITKLSKLWNDRIRSAKLFDQRTERRVQP